MTMIVMILLMVMNERQWMPEADEAGTLMTEDTHLRHLRHQRLHSDIPSQGVLIQPSNHISVCVCDSERAGEIEAFLYDRVS